MSRGSEARYWATARNEHTHKITCALKTIRNVNPGPLVPIINSFILTFIMWLEMLLHFMLNIVSPLTNTHVEYPHRHPSKWHLHASAAVLTTCDLHRSEKWRSVTVQLLNTKQKQTLRKWLQAQLNSSVSTGEDVTPTYEPKDWFFYAFSVLKLCWNTKYVTTTENVHIKML